MDTSRERVDRKKGEKDNEKEELLRCYKTKHPETKSKIRSDEIQVDEPKSKLEERERPR